MRCTLGVRRVIVKTGVGHHDDGLPGYGDAGIAARARSARAVGHHGRASGDQTGDDVAAGGGRPLWPALFLTDLTANGDGSRAGDWQQGGVGAARAWRLRHLEGARCGRSTRRSAIRN